MRIRGYPEAAPCWFELVTSDVERAKAFYDGLFGWQARTVDGGITFTIRDLAVTGLVPAAGSGEPSAWFTYIASDDAEATAERVVAGAGTVLLPPTDVGTRGRKALFVDPEGAVFGIWQHGTFAGAQIGNEPDVVCWSEVARRDGAGAAAFYGSVFGWAERPGELEIGLTYSEWVAGGRAVAGMVPMDQYPPEVPAHWRTTFEVDNCQASVARVRECGGQVVMGPMDVGVGQYAQVIDPVGASFGIIELVPSLRGLETPI